MFLRRVSGKTDRQCTCNPLLWPTDLGGPMLTFLLNHSVLIIFLLTTAVVARNEYRRYLQRNKMDAEEFKSRIRERINEVGSGLLAKLATALVVAAAISMISFREIFLNDVFHTVFLTMLLVKPVHKYLSRLFE